jgi:small subunit ribosomal protein S13
MTKKEAKKEGSKGKKEDYRYIVRIVGKDLDGTKPIHIALMGIKGISHRTGKVIAKQFEKETGIPWNTELGKIDEKYDKTLESIILAPQDHGIPTWMLNRRKDYVTGRDMHVVMGELDFAVREDIKRLNIIKSYRGLRHSWGLPVRGQKTKSTHRGKGPVVGVMKKEAQRGK